MKKLTLILIAFITSFLNSQSKKESWETYIATYEKSKPGSTTVRMDLINSVPNKEFEYVLVTGIKYESKREDGFPEKQTFDKLYKVTDGIIEILNKNCKNIIVGSFTYDYERLDYFYLQSENGIKEKLENFYKRNFPKEKYYINLIKDTNWKYYREFLYPNEETINYIEDEKVVRQLIQAGDKLKKERQVDHWVYFSKKENLSLFRKEIEKLNFKIKSQNEKASLERPFEIRIWKVHKVDLNSVNLITNQLRELAKKYNGDYDGWETSVEKE
ncbi:DUF695 domain-containing protein [Polaribacter sp. Hel_I_88]|uniref:DUF695 domain-containing protein n=1 Tax=Polaribacter sp. Hel_I_88 TaxID=1250006 RepID=UPI00047D874C|nr:DUF695 domain-containing protein [Polaribacter sp. Hel_I_88]